MAYFVNLKLGIVRSRSDAYLVFISSRHTIPFRCKKFTTTAVPRLPGSTSHNYSFRHTAIEDYYFTG